MNTSSLTAAVLQLAVPADLEVMTVDAGFTHKASPRNRAGVPRVGPVRRSPLAQVMHLQNHGQADAADGQVTGNLVVIGADALARRALERDGGVVRHVKEITAAQVVVALGFARPQFGGLDGRFQGQSPRVVRVELHPTVHVLEVAPDPAHHHVPGTELRCRMPRLKNPFRHDHPPVGEQARAIPPHFSSRNVTKSCAACGDVGPRRNCARSIGAKKVSR
jgi:hypothetical protein